MSSKFADSEIDQIQQLLKKKFASTSQDLTTYRRLQWHHWKPVSTVCSIFSFAVFGLCLYELLYFIFPQVSVTYFVLIFFFGDSKSWYYTDLRNWQTAQLYHNLIYEIDRWLNHTLTWSTKSTDRLHWQLNSMLIYFFSVTLVLTLDWSMKSTDGSTVP